MKKISNYFFFVKSSAAIPLIASLWQLLWEQILLPPPRFLFFFILLILVLNFNFFIFIKCIFAHETFPFSVFLRKVLSSERVTWRKFLSEINCEERNSLKHDLMETFYSAANLCLEFWMRAKRKTWNILSGKKIYWKVFWGIFSRHFARFLYTKFCET